jgi:hypothetical protein
MPEWYDEMDVEPNDGPRSVVSPNCRDDESPTTNAPQELAYCFLQASRLQFGAFETLTRYETALWRQAAQLIFMLHSTGGR